MFMSAASPEVLKLGVSWENDEHLSKIGPRVLYGRQVTM